MKIVSDDKRSYIEMLFQGTSVEDTKVTGMHIFEISITASCDGFYGYNDSISFTDDEIQRFLNEMRTLENQRKGIAKLVSIGYPSEYTEFMMHIMAINEDPYQNIRKSQLGYKKIVESVKKTFLKKDNITQFAVKFDLQQIKYLGLGLSPRKFSASFDLDSSDLRNTVAELEGLFNRKDSISN